LQNQTGHKFTGKSKTKVSFKTIERLSSDPEVMLAIYNLRILLFEKGINESNITGDGASYSSFSSKTMSVRQD